MLGEMKTLRKGVELSRKTLLTHWELSFLGGHFSYRGSSLPGRAALPVGGNILRQEAGSGLSLPWEVTTLRSRLDGEELPRTITCVSFAPGAKTELVMLV